MPGLLKGIVIHLFITLLYCMTPISPAVGMDRFDIVTSSELHNLLLKRNQGETDFILVNTLDTIIARHHTIPGSINIPWSDINRHASLLGKDKHKPIITYCMGYR
ncbi:rhodanese-like domain-containing protein [Desulfogranum japonicum]|uniref:rhodanese-like domain-containing protein n=1 Tax=Desulfogranum japonicum TaxID=231447 RepID=UPI000418067B|nr:rhodanese-like domain-containing protein [Desulfogranum japonicum]